MKKLNLSLPSNLEFRMHSLTKSYNDDFIHTLCREILQITILYLQKGPVAYKSIHRELTVLQYNFYATRQDAGGHLQT